MNFEKNLEKYAELAVKIGVNVQSGQTLVINAPIETAEFVRKIVKKAYECGAKNVHIDWADEECTLIKYLNAPDEAFNEYPMWLAKGYEDMAKEGAAFLNIYAQNPDLLKDVDPTRVANAQKASGIARKKWREYVLADKCRWSIVSVPTKEWSAKIFPGLSEEERTQKLWDAIFKVTRVDQEDPIESWKNHTIDLEKRMNFLNEKKFKKLYFKSPKTDLTIELPKGHIWSGGASKDPNDIDFIANIPTEEIFSMPSKFGVNGVVSSTKPLIYGGNTIENFTLTFKDGKIVEFTAQKGYETLANLIDTDEGSHYLGEVALVPFRSPISDTNIIFYNTLYDENASCHLAIGSAYLGCIEGGTNMSKEEKEANGVNDSLTHVDFMVGSSDMNIIGETYDGENIQVFKDGNWAF